jgi:hypothetical protein
MEKKFWQVVYSHDLSDTSNLKGLFGKLFKSHVVDMLFILFY